MEKIVCPICKNENNKKTANFCRACGAQLKDKITYLDGFVPRCAVEQ